MKEVKAYIKTHKLDAVILALHKIKDLPGMSVVDVRGCGHRHEETGHDQQMEELVHHAKVEIVCSDEQADRIVRAIKGAAHTGLHGDGKIYVSSVDRAIKIETDEEGDQAV